MAGKHGGGGRAARGKGGRAPDAGETSTGGKEEVKEVSETVSGKNGLGLGDGASGSEVLRGRGLKGHDAEVSGAAKEV